jgi:hypothetical protein
MRKQNRASRTWSQPKDATRRTGKGRDHLVVPSWGQLNEREPQRAAGPYEVTYEVALGYCCERAIVLP